MSTCLAIMMTCQANITGEDFHQGLQRFARNKAAENPLLISDAAPDQTIRAVGPLGVIYY
jgi:hypothetical protein